jgi:hypothetical protein
MEGPIDKGNLGKTFKLTDRMFQGQRRGTSMNLPNLVRPVVIPLLTRCPICYNPKHLHADDDHELKLDETIPK